MVKYYLKAENLLKKKEKIPETTVECKIPGTLVPNPAAPSLKLEILDLEYWNQKLLILKLLAKY